MQSIPFKLSVAAILLLSSSATAFAQGYDSNAAGDSQSYSQDSGQPTPQDQAQYQQQLQQYQDQQQQYQNQRNAYDSRTQAWRDRRAAYDAQHDSYNDQQSAYEQQRADYDAQYGAGAWERRYGYADARRGGYDYYRSSPCERRASSGAAAGGVIGALAGAAIGSSVAGRGSHATGAILGGLAGGAIGAAAGSSAAQCDSTGYYFGYEDTYPYQVADADRYGRYDYYRHSRCRLAIAPAYVDGSMDDRYVRVCPDGAGRYRITP
ncbi:MAG TPA: hypothetical protein VIJ94_09490 [Caulobacteraceae bacterium]